MVDLDDREPVYDYCGKIIGYTERNIQSQQEQSIGAPVENNIAPGNVGLQESGTVVFPPPATTTNLAGIDNGSISNTTSGIPQTLELTGTTLAISDGNEVDLALITRRTRQPRTSRTTRSGRTSR